MKAFMFLALLVSVGCASTQLNQQEAAVRILRKSDPPKECKELGKVMVNGYEAVSEEGKDAVLKKKVYALGGNILTVDRYENENTVVHGTAFNCP